MDLDEVHARNVLPSAGLHRKCAGAGIERDYRLPPHAPGMRIGLFGGTFDPPHEAHLARLPAGDEAAAVSTASGGW